MNESYLGIWQPLYAELGGDEAPRMMLERMELELTKDTYTVRFGGVTADHGSYAPDADGITLQGIAGPNAGRTIPCRSRFVDGLLSICYGLNGVRPTAFTTQGDPQRYLVNYRRKE